MVEPADFAREAAAGRAPTRYAYRGMHQDTSDAQLVRYHRLLRAMTAAQRVAATESLCQALRVAAMAGLRQRHPHAEEPELRIRLLVRLYGRTEGQRVFGAIPDDAV